MDYETQQRIKEAYDKGFKKGYKEGQKDSEDNGDGIFCINLDDE